MSLRQRNVPRFVMLPPLENPCPRCDGSGSEYKLRKDGKRDRRYWWPIGPCLQCHGSKSA